MTHSANLLIVMLVAILLGVACAMAAFSLYLGQQLCLAQGQLLRTESSWTIWDGCLVKIDGKFVKLKERNQ